jgi:putative DNA primase/helicase
MISNENMLKAGFSLIPIPLGQKGPTLPGWNTPERCLSNTTQHGILSGKNIGLAHAYCTPTPTCAIDIDNYKHAKSWLASHGIDLCLLLRAPGAVVIWSGKKYSLKLLYRLPPGVPALESKKINGADGKSAVEFRCATKDGKTVQDVLPPSIHPDGHEYQWMGDGNPLHLPEIPPTVLDLWRLLIANGSRVANRQFSGGHASAPRQESPRQIATINAGLQHIDADCSYEIWRNVVWAILSTRWTCAEAIAESWSRSAPDCYDDDAFWVLVNSYMPNHSSPISVGTIYHHARKGGWNG